MSGNIKYTKARRRLNKSGKSSGENVDSLQVSLVDGDDNSRTLVWKKMEDCTRVYESMMCCVLDCSSWSVPYTDNVALQ